MIKRIYLNASDFFKGALLDFDRSNLFELDYLVFKKNGNFDDVYANVGYDFLERMLNDYGTEKEIVVCMKDDFLLEDIFEKYPYEKIIRYKNGIIFIIFKKVVDKM